jgi:aryl-phospho-beta-D-glucosidase BglC (GH1 family)
MNAENGSYILRVLQWARKYGIRVNLDLHTIPGSQNGMWQGASLMFVHTKISVQDSTTPVNSALSIF